jgi:hypothetical protein
MIFVAENWAQLSGKQRQNTVQSDNVALSSGTGSASASWGGRWGHAITVIENRQAANSEPLPFNLRTRVFVLGGESYKSEGVPDTEMFAGTGKYLNDIWRSLFVGKATGFGLVLPSFACVPNA